MSDMSETHEEKKLKLLVDGRIIDHLGLKMYQSAVAAIAEIISNSWDADAKNAFIELPQSLNESSVITVKDDGSGMTFAQCQDSYLSVAKNRRALPTDRSKKGRQLLGRKGIGKFAGFGIANIIEVETVSRENGERTVFEMDVKLIRSDNFDGTASQIKVLAYEPPNDERRNQGGTTIKLRQLNDVVQRNPSVSAFSKGMSRRFTLLKTAGDFIVHVNGSEISECGDFDSMQFDFPQQYEEERKKNLDIQNGWAHEKLPSGNTIRWRIGFYEKPIEEDSLRGISVFAHGKLAQSPFFFNLEGGSSGQLSQAYMTGRVEADFLDELDEDVISTERQRVDWSNERSTELLEWGKTKLKELQTLWQELRNKEKNDLLDRKMAGFSSLLDRLTPRERKNIEAMIKKAAQIPTMNKAQFETFGFSLLTLWDGGKLSAVLEEMVKLPHLTSNALAEVLTETDILSTLNMGESVRAKLETVITLNEMITSEEKENRLRDYIAGYPWLLGPEWEFFIKEKTMNEILVKASTDARLEELEGYKGRADLVLTNSRAGFRKFHVVEFMRPGAPADMDHLARFEDYVTMIKAGLKNASVLESEKDITGYLIADKIDKANIVFSTRLEEIRGRGLHAMDWGSLLNKSVAQWGDFLDVLISKAPDDPRIKALAQRLGRT